MKLRSAHIKNFRLLKDLNLDFSTDSDKSLTVIRAANETGKTTSETALIWGLYGSNALPGKGQRYPLYPSDSISLKLNKVEISVEIEFENIEVINAGKPSQTVENRRYKLLRSCIERPSTEPESFKRDNEIINLFEVTRNGVTPIEGSKVRSIIENSIPHALKDVYFTDGDSAMSFIEAAATTGVKRRRVRDAVEALLGLETLENTIKHLNLVGRRFGEEIDVTDYSAKFVQLNDIIDGYDDDLDEWREELLENEIDLKEGQHKLASIETKIEGILLLGDKDKLVKLRQACKDNIKRNSEAADRALIQVSNLLREKDLSASLIGGSAQKGLKILEELSEKKEIPKVNIPILEELLDRQDCFCGETLDPDAKDGAERRKSIENAIENSREADFLSEAASSLFYSVRSQMFGNDSTSIWKDRYMLISREYADRSADVNKFHDDHQRLDEEIDSIKDANLDILRENSKSLKSTIEHTIMRVGTLSGQIKGVEEKKSDRIIERDRVEKKAKKSGVSTANLDATRLCIKVLENVFDRMRTEEVEFVSGEMNRIFLEMIGSRPEENDLTLITKSELTPEFDIRVYGTHGHLLDPDTDLNGASRRAITLAFILAITKVSKVEAPNVIDTPLGMMSGYVKQSVLLQTLNEGTQTILFLTHDEIKGVEEIIDKKAGEVYTLTNPAHFPNMLRNKPQVSDARIIRCECNHRQSCEVCERINAISD